MKKSQKGHKMYEAGNINNANGAPDNEARCRWTSGDDTIKT